MALARMTSKHGRQKSKRRRTVLFEPLERRDLLATLTVNTSSSGGVTLPAFDEQLGTLTSARVTVEPRGAYTNYDSIPGTNHSHSVSYRSCSGPIRTLPGGTTYSTNSLSTHSHSFNRPSTSTTSISTGWVTNSDRYYSCGDRQYTNSAYVAGRSHGHSLESERFYVYATYYYRPRFFGGSTQSYSAWRTSTDGYTLPRFPYSLSSYQIVSARVRVDGLSTATTSTYPGSFAHRHYTSLYTGPFRFTGYTYTTNPSSNGSHYHYFDLSRQIRTFTSPSDLNRYFLTGSNVFLPQSGSMSSYYSHAHSPRAVPFTTTTTFTYMTDLPPNADAGGPYTGQEGLQIQFDASRTSDANQPHTELTYEWDLDYDGASFQVDATGMLPTATFADDFATRTIAVRVRDNGGLIDVATTTLQILNKAPSIDRLGGNTTGSEGSRLSFSGVASDPAGTNDTLIYTWDFGDGAIGPSGIDLTDVQHTYLDDGNYVVTLTVADEDGGSTGGTLPISIDNVPPTIQLAGANGAEVDVPWLLTLGAISDPGQDTVQEWIVDWGDSSASSYTSGGAVSHTYTNGPAFYTVSVSLRDEDGTHAAAGTVEVAIAGVELSKGKLLIVGTVRADHIYLRKRGDELRVHASFEEDVPYFAFALTDITEIEIYAGNGRDMAQVPHDLEIPSMLNGGSDTDTLRGGAANDLLVGGPGHDRLSGRAGNDVLDGLDGNDRMWGGEGNDILLGGRGDDDLNGQDGDDTLRGADGNDNLLGLAGVNMLLGNDGQDNLQGHGDRELLIGGMGADHVRGRAEEDILIGGITDYDDNQSVLDDVLSMWNSTANYDSRVNDLQIGYLNSFTVRADGASDTFRGESGLDLLFADMVGDHDVIDDLAAGESLDQIVMP